MIAGVRLSGEESSHISPSSTYQAVLFVDAYEHTILIYMHILSSLLLPLQLRVENFHTIFLHIHHSRWVSSVTDVTRGAHLHIVHFGLPYIVQYLLPRYFRVNIWTRSAISSPKHSMSNMHFLNWKQKAFTLLLSRKQDLQFSYMVRI